jgi:hypothetical protein
LFSFIILFFLPFFLHLPSLLPRARRAEFWRTSTCNCVCVRASSLLVCFSHLRSWLILVSLLFNLLSALILCYTPSPSLLIVCSRFSHFELNVPRAL